MHMDGFGCLTQPLAKTGRLVKLEAFEPGTLRNSQELVSFPGKKFGYVKFASSDSARRAMDMVQQLLTLSRKQEVALSPADLNVLIRNVMEIRKNTFDKSIRLDS